MPIGGIQNDQGQRHFLLNTFLGAMVFSEFALLVMITLGRQMSDSLLMSAFGSTFAIALLGFAGTSNE